MRPCCADMPDSDWPSGSLAGKDPRCYGPYIFPVELVSYCGWSDPAFTEPLGPELTQVFVSAEDVKLVPYARDSCSLFPMAYVILRNACVRSVPVP